MLKWLRNRFSRVTDEDDVALEIDADEEEESFSPVGVRVRPAEVAKLEPADTNVSGYNVVEGVLRNDDEYSTTVNDIKTTGVDPYNSGGTERQEVEEPVPDK